MVTLLPGGKYGSEALESSSGTTKMSKKQRKLSPRMDGSRVEMLELSCSITRLSKSLIERRIFSNSPRVSM